MESQFVSEDGKLEARVIESVVGDHVILFYRHGHFVAAESYEGKHLNYYEDTAENYVMGIKRVESHEHHQH